MFYKLVFGQSEHFDLLKPVLDNILQGKEDLVIVGDDGGIVETHKILFIIFSKTMTGIIDEHSGQGISIPAKSETVRNLIRILTEGTVIVSSRDELENVVNCGQIIGIDFTKLEIQSNNLEGVLCEDVKNVERSENRMGQETDEFVPAETLSFLEVELKGKENTMVSIEELEPANNVVNSEQVEQRSRSEPSPMNHQQILNKDENLSTKKMYKCGKCVKTFANLKCFNDHMLEAICDEGIKCKYCNIILKSKKTLRVHIENIHNRPLFKCSECDLVFKSDNWVEKHIQKTHIPKMCKFCNLQLKNSMSLSVHLFRCKVRREAAGLPQVNSVKKETEEEFLKACDLCEKTFRSKNGLRAHMDLHKLVEMNESIMKMKTETDDNNAQD